tara:strand:+ start:378 stop:1166 length:789 start_codon:yes stop_codon:yes gene_type:complete
MIWNNRLRGIMYNKNFNLVISDNLCAPLQYNPDCILFGSFLWHDIIKKTNENENVLNFERDLFRNNRPTIYGMKNFLMPEITKHGNFIEYPNLINKFDSIKKKSHSKHKIFITAGKSGDLLQKYTLLAKHLAKCKSFEIIYDTAMKNDSIKRQLFDYTENSFSDLSIIIARPGIGIISDAIRFNIPIIVDTFYENKELEFNASKIDELGIGKRLNFSELNHLSKDIMNLLNDNDCYHLIINNLGKIPGNGASLIADSIIKKV